MDINYNFLIPSQQSYVYFTAKRSGSFYIFVLNQFYGKTKRKSSINELVSDNQMIDSNMYCSQQIDKKKRKKQKLFSIKMKAKIYLFMY